MLAEKIKYYTCGDFCNWNAFFWGGLCIVPYNPYNSLILLEKEILLFLIIMIIFNLGR